MKYTREEKRHIDNLLNVFSDFISKHCYFDIGYADKSGYIHIHLNNDFDVLDCISMNSLDDVLIALFDEVADDVRAPRVCAGDESYCLYPHEVQDVYNIISPLAAKLPSAAERIYCMKMLDVYCCNTPEEAFTGAKTAEVDWGAPQGEEVW